MKLCANPMFVVLLIDPHSNLRDASPSKMRQLLVYCSWLRDSGPIHELSLFRLRVFRFLWHIHNTSLRVIHTHWLHPFPKPSIIMWHPIQVLVEQRPADSQLHFFSQVLPVKTAHTCRWMLDSRMHHSYSRETKGLCKHHINVYTL